MFGLYVTETPAVSRQYRECATMTWLLVNNKFEKKKCGKIRCLPSLTYNPGICPEPLRKTNKAAVTTCYFVSLMLGLFMHGQKHVAVKFYRLTGTTLASIQLLTGPRCEFVCVCVCVCVYIYIYTHTHEVCLKSSVNGIRKQTKQTIQTN